MIGWRDRRTGTSSQFIIYKRLCSQTLLLLEGEKVNSFFYVEIAKIFEKTAANCHTCAQNS